MNNQLDPNVRPHTTHHACDERLAKYGGKTIGCCCTGHFCQVNTQIVSSSPLFDMALTARVSKAMQYAFKAHDGQTRDDGDDFINHPAQTYEIIAKATNDEALHCAAWLHDTIEDTETTYEDLLAEFGKDVADLVNEVTHEGSPDSKGYYYPRLHTQRGIMLKFADRLSNISDMATWDDKRKAHYLRRSKFWKSEP